jgi:hypothetical protein
LRPDRFARRQTNYTTYTRHGRRLDNV